jgi:protein-S-isoprenylcysteine O-methyltransferase Ste14|tara:strand:- start:715 stop:1161 length:447 start_codon:yes stop_codon:yes gene_type:complete
MREPPKIKPPFIALFYLILAIVLNYLLPDVEIISYSFIGIVIVLLGLSLLVWAASQFKKHGTPRSPFKKPTSIVIKGPFLFTRNPMYLGMILILLGIAVEVGTIPMFLGPLAFLFTIRIWFIPYEEDKMKKLFGEEYLDYKKKVRRWL